eukprot:CAMPEP_0119109944 /NCGR_PEP_ID=MMETSP1180-20130426/25234_1 /TAXON_ID=3052 ORGANISM="Chlamydomonas cf sp, Strain CCMP681" /NCGR_SAMPLE_ID=MMETSP1180 /ASSEMBLY_ACC=CAM_ASM_000741 /LENGTH=36 /DNA_ID= /DNA_START= /DNA_END= /DNA_ORIENTATION=
MPPDTSQMTAAWVWRGLERVAAQCRRQPSESSARGV